MKIKKSGFGCQVSGVEAPGPPTLKGFNSNSVPVPSSGTKLPMKADIRRILRVPGVGAGPARILAETFQFGSLVRPARCTAGPRVPLVTKPITAESYTKSPWKPT